jgi:transcription-repair coupling factor (superfamily II helicase)
VGDTHQATATLQRLAVISEIPALQGFRQRMNQGGLLSLGAVDQAGLPFLAGLVANWFPASPIVVVTEGLKAQELVHQDLTTWVGLLGDRAARPVLFYPAWENLPHEARLPHVDVVSERLAALVALGEKRATAPVLVASVAALLQRTYSPAFLRDHLRRVARGERLEPLDLIEWLEDQGYEPEAQVNHKGEIALRGGILDVFPLSSPWPVRLEFFGDEVESLRCFDPITQISREAVEAVVLPPAGEVGILKKMSAPPALLLEHLPKETLFVLASPENLARNAAQYAEQIPAADPFFAGWDEVRAAMQARGMTVLEVNDPLGEILAATPPTGEEPAIASLDAFRPVPEKAPELPVAEWQRKEFFQQVHRWLRQGLEVLVFCNNEGERQRFVEIWREMGLSEDQAAGGRAVTIQISSLARGFLFEAARLVVVTDAEIFGRYKVPRPRRLKVRQAQAVRSLLEIDFADLEDGDYVVHLQHGIGKYVGLKVLPAPARKRPDGVSAPVETETGQECLVIEYAPANPENPPPRLYVPVSEAHLVSKYIGAGKGHPQLNTLGGKRWGKAKAEAEHAVKDMAAEMLRIQVARETEPGHSFGPDTPWQREFEGAFLYEETADQVRAIDDTKRDMEMAKPMDRLICGDVGFGKTEVAIRAAFKAVMNGKQVAILTPTTVLAQQHYNTFVERMADYPVRVELLSRFRSRREQQRVIEQLAAGGVDVVVGTHRLVQPDVSFKDLGLVIVDEEQRFGVAHKERLKRLRIEVDVLTLSATPIPRTLHLALMGARDMSTIETPPQDRLPVETIVTQYDERLVRDVIQRELNREGQVFFLHNRVFDIEAVALRLQTLVPRARIVVGHGQMDADDLEKVMTRFVNGEADVLVSTTIIESGLDIPNANTIIIDRADRFGLSDLYQLRGRVGRYKHQAYAYLLIPRHATLLSDARKRISAIRQYSRLGSGFKVAMRDLEIRGAGSLLGTQQSGHINAIGFDLYCQLLKQSVAALKGEKVKPRLDLQVRLDFLALNPAEESAAPIRSVRPKPAAAADQIEIPREVAVYYQFEETVAEEDEEAPIAKVPAYIPFDYIADSRLRIEAYRKLAQATEAETVAQLRQEWRDRFGPPPDGVETLLLVQELKILATQKGIAVLETRGNRLMLTRNGDYISLGGKFPRLAKRTAKGRLGEIRRLLQAL